MVTFQQMKSAAKLLLPVGLTLLLLYSLAPTSHASQTPPIVTGWSGSRLLESSRFSLSTPGSDVFPGENASDMEMQTRLLVQKGFNGYRASFAPYCTDPSGFFGAYNSTQLHRSIEIAAHYGLWVIVDYHGYSDLQTDASTLCWLNFWSDVVQQFMGSYDKIIWEPLNEPNVTLSSLPSVSLAYQRLVNQVRSLGDEHWIVIENICSYACALPVSNYWIGYPTVSDPAGRLFISLHAYFPYRYYSSEWSNATADKYARSWLLDMLNGTASTGWPVLNTEGGPGRPFGRLTNGTMITCPDLILNGSSGYCATNFHFVQTLTNLLDHQATGLQSRLNWLWFPMADWSSTPGAGIYGSLSATGPGWGTILVYKNAPPLLNLTLSVRPNALTIYPGDSKSVLVALNSTGFAGTANLTTVTTPSGPFASFTNSMLQLTPNGHNTTVFVITVPPGTAAGAYDVRVTGSGDTTGSHAAIIRLIVRDFKITVNPQVVRVPAGQRTVSQIGLVGLNNFNDSITLSVTSSPSVSDVTIVPLIVTLQPGQTSTAALSFNSSIADIYTLTVTGQSEGAFHSANETVIIEDFKLAVNPPVPRLLAGSIQTITLTVNGIDGFSGNVTLTASIIPEGPTVGVTRRVLSVSSGGLESANLTVDIPSTAIGHYTFTVDAIGNGIHHQIVVPIDVTRPASNPASSSPFPILGLQALQVVGLVTLVVAVGSVLFKKFGHRSLTPQSCFPSIELERT